MTQTTMPFVTTKSTSYMDTFLLRLGRYLEDPAFSYDSAGTEYTYTKLAAKGISPSTVTSSIPGFEDATDFHFEWGGWRVTISEEIFAIRLTDNHRIYCKEL